MKLHKAYSAKTPRGFTMIELIVVIAIVGAIFAAGSIVMFDSIQRSVALNEQNLVVTLLMGQRTKALSNVNQSSFGLKVEANQYTLFQGNSFSGGVDLRPVQKGTAITTGGDTEFVFGQLSGTSTAGTMTVTDGSKTVSIVVNSEGRIEW